MTDWMKLLTTAIAASSKQNVARELGISRSQVSLVANGKYIASTEHIAKKVLSRYGRIHCPHLSAEITPDECNYNHKREAPTSNPREMKHWRACQTCKNNLTATQGDRS